MPDTSGVPEDAAALRVTVAGLRAENESLRALLEDKNAKVTELEAQNAELAQRLARVERLISRNSGFSELQAFPSGCGSRRLVPAASLAAASPVILRHAITGLDQTNLHLVTNAVRQAGGRN